MAVPSILLNSGRKMPMVGLGTWKSKKGDVEKAVECALECGYRHIDCAWIYQNENEIGEALSKLIKARKIKREDVFITSKLWNTFHNPKDVRNALMDSMKNLQTDYLDLYLMHWPFCYINNGEKFPKDQAGNVLFDDVDYVETWKAMEELQKEGLVRSIGVSNFNEFQLNRILKECSLPPAVNQIELHPYLLQQNMVDFCKEKGITVTAYSPLGSPDRPWAEKGEPILLDDEKLAEIASRLNKTVAQVILRHSTQRGLIIIPKSVTPARIKSNLELFDFKLSEEDTKIIDGFERNFRACILKLDIKHKYFPFQENYSE